ncbi:XRE family transcriptional regulator [Spongiactinospora gelatinilytica]|uniref:XRE family transcriptional regulator n=1 Tax=Spongiactinospora gelatinilytica TaxID=2666298 RepID=A0A2W2GMW3_9ACTN|nr:helix-turn-helix transcriptional regulator [Spongiactinospora gelatinilytica]PZG41395.1 XRE family transcriptional regulator [Spongiactinospora gelatinilytica]
MVDDLAGKGIGARIQIIRERKGMTRETVAGLVGRSGQWLKDIEKGRRGEPRLSVLLKLAEILAVTNLAQLLGDEVDVPVAAWRRIPHPAVPAIREAVHAQPLTLEPAQVDAGALQSRVSDAWQLWHRSSTQRTDVGRLLPSLITDARAAVRATEGTERRVANAALAHVYGLCEQLLAWTSEPELLWLTADRGIAAAQDADTPESLAGAAWVLGNVRRAVADFDGARELLDDAIRLLAPYLEDGSDDLRGMWGSLHLHQAVTCARAGHEGDAWRYWDEADRTAERLGVAYMHPWTVFGKANVQIHAVSVGADLAKSSEARRRAELVDPAGVQSLDRRSRLLIETARAYQLQRDWAGALHFLRRAHEASSEAVMYQPIARGIAVEILDRGGPLVAREARAFAALLKIPA